MSNSQEKPKDVIGVMGTPVSSGNRGVLALGASLLNLCVEATGGGQAFLLLSHRSNEPAHFHIQGKLSPIKVVNICKTPFTAPQHHILWVVIMSLLYHLLPFKLLRALIRRVTPWIDAVASASLVGDVRGGDSFSDIYGLRRFIMGFLSVWTVILIRGEIVQFPQTYGPYKTRIARTMARYLLRRSSVVIARDKQSQRVAENLIGATKKVVLCPDVAFSLSPRTPEKLLLSPPLTTSVLPAIVGLNVNGLMLNGGYDRRNMFGLKLDYSAFLAKVSQSILDRFDGELWLIPHTYAPLGNVESDNEACLRVRDSLPASLQDRVRIVVGNYDCHELKAIIGLCDFFIGSRMHSCIAALSQGVPCVGVAYSMKFQGVFETVGMGDWVIDGRTVGDTSAAIQTLELFDRRDDVRETLTSNSRRVQRELRTIFKNLVSKCNNQDGSGLICK